MSTNAPVTESPRGPRPLSARRLARLLALATAAVALASVVRTAGLDLPVHRLARLLAAFHP